MADAPKYDTDASGWTGEKSDAPAAKFDTDASGWSGAADPDKKDVPPDQSVAPLTKAPWEGPVVGIGAHYKQDVERGLDQMKRPGVMNKALGAAGYLGSPLSALSEGVMGDPARMIMSKLGAGKGAQDFAGKAAETVGDIAGPGMFSKAAKLAPVVVEEFPKAARAVGGVMRSGVNAADDIVKAALERRSTGQALKAADAAPTRDVLKAQASEAFKDAAKAGVEVKPEAFKSFVDTVPNTLKAEKVTSGKIPISEKIYPQTKDLQDRLEAYVGEPLTLENLQTLQQEAHAFVKKALIAAEGDRGASDVRGAQIISKQIKSFVDGLKPEQIASGDPQKALGALNKARELWRRQAKMETVQDIVDVAKKTKDAGYIQSQFRALIKDPLEYRNFSPKEQKLIEDVAGGSRLSDVAEAAAGHRFGAVRRLGKAVVGDAGEQKKAQALIDLIARGEGAQAAPAAPTLGQRVGAAVSPQGRNAADAARRKAQAALRGVLPGAGSP